MSSFEAVGKNIQIVQTVICCFCVCANIPSKLNLNVEMLRQKNIMNIYICECYRIAEVCLGEEKKNARNAIIKPLLVWAGEKKLSMFRQTSCKMDKIPKWTQLQEKIAKRKLQALNTARFFLVVVNLNYWYRFICLCIISFKLDERSVVQRIFQFFGTQNVHFVIVFFIWMSHWMRCPIEYDPCIYRQPHTTLALFIILLSLVQHLISSWNESFKCKRLSTHS